MKAAKTWCLAGLILVAGLSSVSCGKDEGTDGGGGRGTVLGGNGGNGGNSTAGLPGRSGSANNDGGVGAEGPSTATKLGRACVSAKDCDDPAAPGLTCITAKDTLLGDGAPPKGLCTTTCTMPSDEDPTDTCAALGPGGMCFPFDASSDEGYCIEGCEFGRPDIGDAKCHSRPEFACNPALLGPTGTACIGTEDCPSGDLCIEGECAIVFAGCLPACRGDLDCAADMYCDQGFLNGVCTPVKPTGKGLGEPCTVPAAGAPQEPDGCLGFCQADSDTGNQGHCSATCGLGRECSWNTGTQKFDGRCLYPSALTAETGDIGDFGFCTPSCNCTDECNDPALACTLLSQGPLPSTFRGPGLCFSPDANTDEYNQCDGGGGAGGDGAGGTSASGAANGGDGSGGVPAGGAGG